MSEKNIIVSPWKRFFARGIDIVLIQLLLIIFYGIAETEPGLGFWFFTIVISLVYEPLCYSISGATLGKAILGIRVVGENGERLSLGAIFKRTLGVWFYGMGLYLPVVCQIANLYYLIKYDDLKGITTWDNLVSGHVVYKKNLKTQASAVIKNKEEEVAEDVPIAFLSKEIKNEEGKRNKEEGIVFEENKTKEKFPIKKSRITLILGLIIGSMVMIFLASVIVVYFNSANNSNNYSAEQKVKKIEAVTNPEYLKSPGSFLVDWDMETKPLIPMLDDKDNRVWVEDIIAYDTIRVSFPIIKANQKILVFSDVKILDSLYPYNDCAQGLLIESLVNLVNHKYISFSYSIRMFHDDPFYFMTMSRDNLDPKWFGDLSKFPEEVDITNGLIDIGQISTENWKCDLGYENDLCAYVGRLKEIGEVAKIKKIGYWSCLIKYD